MHLVLLAQPGDFSAYLGEMLHTWGLPLYEIVPAEALTALDPVDVPVVVCPAWEEESLHQTEVLLTYAHRGGSVLCMLPDGELAAAAGLRCAGEKEGPLRIRITERPAAGLAGELLPIVGRAQNYVHAPEVKVLAYLSHPGQYRGETLAVVETPVGQGKVVAFAFDLPLCVLMLRQGDPKRAEFIPEGDGCARPSHLAADIGPYDAGWIPHADLLTRLFVDMVRHYLPMPAPMLYHLPEDAAGILLYSGDEDYADVSTIEEQLDYLAAAGARMNLYIIPVHTQSSKADVQRYATHHDVGPHPDLRPLDGHPVAERVAEFERQIQLFQEMFGIKPRSLRNHCTAWAGYMELVEAMERLGVRMDGNYFTMNYMRNRECAPYAGFGAAMPMRFCRLDGYVLDVRQQHSHISDDGMFGAAEYSYRISPQQYAVMLDRIFTDIVTRFHTPYAVCVHPSNWVRFSRPQGQELLRQAQGHGMPVWSFDQWSAFCDARDTWRFHSLQWDGAELRFIAEGSASHAGLRLMLPEEFEGRSLKELKLDDETIPWQMMVRYREKVALVPLPTAGRLNVCAQYG